jgi:hypothetical protein
VVCERRERIEHASPSVLATGELIEGFSCFEVGLLGGERCDARLVEANPALLCATLGA